MPFTIQGYDQQRELGSGVNTPGVRPSVTNTGLGEAIERGASKVQTVVEHLNHQNAISNATAAANETPTALW